MKNNTCRSQKEKKIEVADKKMNKTIDKNRSITISYY